MCKDEIIRNIPIEEWSTFRGISQSTTRSILLTDPFPFPLAILALLAVLATVVSTARSSAALDFDFLYRDLARAPDVSSECPRRWAGMAESMILLDLALVDALPAFVLFTVASLFRPVAFAALGMLPFMLSNAVLLLPLSFACLEAERVLLRGASGPDGGGEELWCARRVNAFD